MKSILFIITIVSTIFGFTSKTYSQYNLVPQNSSFEVYDTCPSKLNQLKYALYWDNPLNTSPDYYNSCDTGIFYWVDIPLNIHGYQFAKHGDAYVGIITYSQNTAGNATNYREYVQSQLTDTLTQGTEYFVKFYVSPGDSCQHISNNLGIYFSNYKIDTTIFPNYPLPFQPQIENSMSNDLNDRNSWTEVSGTFTALGGENYIIIGNFDDSSNTINTYVGWGTNLGLSYAYYYIDDVLVTPVDSLTNIYEYNQLNELVYNINQYEISVISESQIQSISLYDLNGSIIFQNNNINSNQCYISIANLNHSLYFVNTILKNNSIFNYKFIKP